MSKVTNRQKKKQAAAEHNARLEREKNSPVTRQKVSTKTRVLLMAMVGAFG